MRNSIWSKRCCVVVGSSRGLGAALVDGLLRHDVHLVVGVARTKLEDVPNHRRWVASQRYRHVEMDVARRESLSALKGIAEDFPSEPLLVIFNAACLLEDVRPDLSIDYQVFEEVNRVGVIGFGHVLGAFESHLLQHGGTFVAISSINAFRPPVLDRRVAYPASKAYLHMAMRSLRLIWPNKVRLVTIHLGHIGGNHKGRFFDSIKPPSYENVAEMIVREISNPNAPSEITYPVIYRILYRGILRIMPDTCYRKLLQFCLKIIGAK